MPDLVRAAGGVVWRGGGGDLELLLVHRSRYQDWSLPKGKLDDGESFERAAVREVHEETGVHGVLGVELPSTRYVDGRGRPKIVRYWLIEAAAIDPWDPDDEVDELRWLQPDDARELLSYEHDVDVVDAALDHLLG